MRPTLCPRCHEIAPRVVLTDGATRVTGCARCADKAAPELEPAARPVPEVPETVPTDSEGWE